MADASLCPGCFQPKENGPVCPACGFDENATVGRSHIVLPYRTLLNGQYLVGKVLGKPGGFGITYLAYDTRLEIKLAIKEFLPRDFAGRDGVTRSVTPHSLEDQDMFQHCMNQFMNEARTLAKFDHPNIVRIRNVFEQNGTAYLVMDYYDGCTLLDYYSRKGGSFSQEEILQLMVPILEGLRDVHERGILHRDIKPHNIYIAREKRPILLDFGSARLSSDIQGRGLTVVLTPGYAPFEQYDSHGRQGPWTDIYACSAVMYWMLTGKPPLDALGRKIGDRMDLEPLKERVSERFLNAMMAALSVEIEGRPRNADEFLKMLAPAGEVPAPVASPPDEKSGETVMLAPTADKETARPDVNEAEMREELLDSPAPQEPAETMLQQDRSPAKELLETVMPRTFEFEDQEETVIRPKPSSNPPPILTETFEEERPPVETDRERTRLADAREEEKRKTVPPQPDPEPGPWKKIAVLSIAGALVAALATIPDWRHILNPQDAKTPLNQPEKDTSFHPESVKTMDPAALTEWANKGEKAARRELGLRYLEGRTVAPDEKQGLKWLFEAAAAGDDEAQREMGRRYLQGTAAATDEAQALAWMGKSADAGGDEAQYELGLRYDFGRGAPRDPKLAREWYRKSAEKKNPKAQNNLGNLYYNGEGVTQDYAQALAWYRLAAEQGFAEAQNNLGEMLAHGEGSVADPTEATRWFKKSAEQGYARGQTNYGKALAKGEGTAQNIVEAMIWYRRAAEQGEEEAKTLLRQR